tara:strand:- start:625 stop:1236 length:612 start_codon:yes stop_codon:yes gene_type:complete
MPKTYIRKLNPYFFRKGKKTNAYYFSIGKRYCLKCKTIKSPSEFYKRKGNKQGLTSQCKICQKARQDLDLKKFGSQPIKMYQKMKFGTLGLRAKKGHSQHKLQITKDEFIKWYNNQTKTCAYCELSIEEYIKIKKHLNRFMQKVSRFGIDRKDNSLPYREDNITLSCSNCNRLKGYWFDEEEFKEIANKYIKPKLNKFLSYEQ